LDGIKTLIAEGHKNTGWFSEVVWLFTWE